MYKRQPIPIEGTNDYRRDREGNVIVTRLNEAMCQEIAKEGKGIYVRAVSYTHLDVYKRQVQSALLEAMQERQVTIGKETFMLPEPFLVLATQNPIEQEGTYRCV